ncbi:MarR family transcriptional regulator [Nesterenkonia sp.]|uniref:MarR family winged helix-turn-helix transcriptional regulator n=1 Tax=Nesterenkonia sp. TaxID=704201 RepID=UPI0026067CE9|nr:MarR family transcriptional regulator [Nesterenkonia sp.]
MSGDHGAQAPPTSGRDLTGFTPKARAWRAFFETSALITDRMEKLLHAATGLKLSDYNLLLLLSEATGNQLRMGELAEKMVFSPSRLSYQVKSLAARGLIDRCTDENDRRGMTARLTQEGRRVFAEASAVHAQHIRKLFHPALDDAQAEDLRAICEQIHTTVEQADTLD